MSLLLIVAIGLVASFLTDLVTFRSGTKTFHVTFWMIAMLIAVGGFYFSS